MSKRRMVLVGFGGDAIFNNVTVNGRGFFADGTAAAPSISFTADTNTGIFRVGNDTVALSGGGVGNLYVTPDGLTGPSNIVKFANSALAQDIRVYGTTTGPKYCKIGHDGVRSFITDSGDIPWYIGTNLLVGNYWIFNNSANAYAFHPSLDNSQSVGLTSNRASNIFSVLGTFGLATNRNADVYIGANSDTSLAQEAAGASVANYIIHRRATGTQAARTIVASGNTISSIIADGWDGANWIDAASILMEVDGTPGTNDMPGRIVFKVTPDGSATLATGMTLNNDKVLNVVGGYKINGTAGITTTVTSASLVGKTITVTNGLITGFA